MARLKKLAIFKTYKNGSNTEEQKQQEMQEYRETLGNRKFIYGLLEKHQNLDEFEVSFVANLFRTLQQYDILGTNQEDGILALARLHSTICSMEKAMFSNVNLLFDVDIESMEATGYWAVKESRFSRQLDANRRLFEKMFYNVLKVTLTHFEELEELKQDVSISDDKEEMNKLNVISILNERMKKGAM